MTTTHAFDLARCGPSTIFTDQDPSNRPHANNGFRSGAMELDPGSPGSAIFGYLRYPVLEEHRVEIVRAIEARAQSCGGPLRNMYYEEPSPVAMLWTLIQGLDRHSGGHLVSAVTNYARTQGIDVRDVINAGQVPPVQWRTLLAELERLRGGWIIAPSPRDFDLLGDTRNVVLQHLAAVNVQVAYLHDLVGVSQHEQSALPEGTEIGQFRVSAFGLAIEITKLSTQMYLNRAGLAYLVDIAMDLLGELVEKRVEDTLVPGRTNQMTVQLIRQPGYLMIQVSETHDHAGDPVGATARAICGPRGVQVARADGGGTITRFQVALAAAAAFHSVPAVRTPK